jgi:prevent-host-death family protein
MARRDVPLEVGVREFRDNLREWLDAVSDGHPVTITERGRPVARLSAVDATSMLERLIAEGAYTPAKAPRRRSRTYPKVKPRAPVSDLVAEQRR